MRELAYWLAIVEARHSWLRLSDSQKERLARCGIVGLSIRPTREWLTVAREARELNLRVAVERWAGEMDGIAGVDDRDGTLAGLQLARYVREAEAEAGRTNAENTVWRDESSGPKKLANPLADEFLDAEASAFHEAEVGLLQYLGYPVPAVHYPHADRDGDGCDDALVPAHVRERYQGLDGAPACWVMDYSSSEETSKRVVERAARAWPNTELGLYRSPGRLNAKGQVVGNATATRNIARAPHPALRAVTLYIGMDQSDVVTSLTNPWMMLFRGHAKHPPIVEFVPELIAIGKEP